MKIFIFFVDDSRKILCKVAVFGELLCQYFVIANNKSYWSGGRGRGTGKGGGKGKGV